MAHALIFDSGVGGLSVSDEIRKLLPDLQQTYVADDAFRPYGNKSQDQLRARLPGLIWTLCETFKPDIVIIACNTASTAALDAIRANVQIPVIGVVPAIKPAAAASQTKSIGILGTPGTVKGHYLDQLIKDFAPRHQVIRVGSTKLVELAEHKLAGMPIDIPVLKKEIEPLFKNADIDHVVLACTHFPLLKTELMSVAPKDIQWIDSGAAIARRVLNVLDQISITGQSTHKDNIAFLIGSTPTSERKASFRDFGFHRVVSLMG